MSFFKLLSNDPNVDPALRTLFCAETHTLPTPAEVQAQRLASAVAEERLTLDVLRHKLHDVADFATQLNLSLPSGDDDLADVIEAIDDARSALRKVMGQERTRDIPALPMPDLGFLNIRGDK